ncbi:hypothetical protein HMPREF1545_02742, partial [Oscillibacter sp. KLE 1728]
MSGILYALGFICRPHGPHGQKTIGRPPVACRQLSVFSLIVLPSSVKANLYIYPNSAERFWSFLRGLSGVPLSPARRLP